MALPMQVIFGWNIYSILLVTGASVTLYSLAGGLVAVIWTDAPQAIVLIAGALICLLAMLAQVPGGASEVTTLFAACGAASELSAPPGTPPPTSDSTGGDDLHAVRMIVAKQKLLQEGTGPSHPGFAALRADRAAALTHQQIGDRVFPHFIANHLPSGLTGLLVAAIFAAAMSTVSTSLNSSATLFMNDFYKRFLNPSAPDKFQMNALYLGTLLWGVPGTGLSFFLVKVTEGALDIWWALSGIIGGGMTGLFLLGIAWIAWP